MTRTKYGNRRTEVGGVTFDSAAEARRWQKLQQLERAGEIMGLERQVRYELLPAFTDQDGKQHQAIHYVADFVYTGPDGCVVVEDVKGMRTAVYQLKAKLFRQRYPELRFREIQA